MCWPWTNFSSFPLIIQVGGKSIGNKISSKISLQTIRKDANSKSKDKSGENNKDNKAAGSRFTIYKVNKASRKKREKSSAKKERKATKTLAIVLG